MQEGQEAIIRTYEGRLVSVTVMRSRKPDEAGNSVNTDQANSFQNPLAPDASVKLENQSEKSSGSTSRYAMDESA
eukprot:768005-Hanusia_phi.AAC.1